jgi:hypothetical protein
MDLMTAITGIPGIGPALPYILAVVAICSALAPFLPAPKTGAGAYAALYGVVNFVALNLGHAKNASAPAATPLSGPGKPVLALLLVAGLMALAGCVTNPDGTASLSPKAQTAINVACAVDPAAYTAGQVGGALIPVPGVAAGLTVDQMLVHPAVVAACAQYGAKPAAAVAPVVVAKPGG